jgi:polyisoprenoid-binding protein YceI
MTMAALVFGAALSAVPALGAESTYTVDKSKSSVSFLATGKPGFLKIKGEGGSLDGKIAVNGSAISGELTAGLAPIKTGISLRDEHMHEKYLETGKFPTAVLKISNVTLDGSSCSFEGLLTIKGAEKPLKGTCEAEGVGSDTLKVSATAEIKMDDFPIGVPSHLGITVAEKVAISANLVAAKTAALQN